VISLSVFRSDLLKSRSIIEAALIEDLSRIDLIIRADGTFDCKSTGMFGVEEQKSGKYKIVDDKLIFDDSPYSVNFIPDTVLISIADSAIFIEKMKSGEYRQVKEFMNHFEIYKMDL